MSSDHPGSGGRTIVVGGAGSRGGKPERCPWKTLISRMSFSSPARSGFAQSTAIARTKTELFMTSPLLGNDQDRVRIGLHNEGARRTTLSRNLRHAESRIRGRERLVHPAPEDLRHGEKEEQRGD